MGNSNATIIRSLDELRLLIEKIFNEKLFKGDLLREVNQEFERKGLNVKTLQLLLNEQINITNLTEYELIAICKICYNKLNWKDLSPKLYFSEVSLAKYENKIKVEEEINVVELKNFLKIDRFNYRGQIEYKDIYKHLNHNNFFYDHEAQRSPKYRMVGSKKGKGSKLRVENLNTKAVEDIAEAIINKTFEDSEIILNCEMIDGKDSMFKFIPKYEDILGDIVIKINYDMESNNTTWISITDGFHRCKGIVLAVSKHLEETDEMLEGSIGVRLVLADKERAKRIVHQTFLRSSDEPEWVNALVKNDYSDFVDLVAQNSKRLNFANTLEVAEVNGKLTSKALLIDVTKKMDIEFNKLSQTNKKAKELAKNFDLSYDVREELGLEINPYRTIGYYYLAYRCAMNKELDIVEIIEKIEENSEFINMSKKFNNLNKYINLIDEVILNG